MKTKILICIIAVLTITNEITAQNRLILKTGEEMLGKTISINDNQLVFEFKGNNLRISLEEIDSIIFSESEDSVIENLGELGNLSGVVTYFFNDNYGDKPDVGAKVFVYKTTKEKSKKELFHKYSDAYRYRLMLSYIKKKDPRYAEYSKKLDDLGIISDEDFKELDKKVSAELFNFTDMNFITDPDNSKSVTVDGNGNYSFQLEPGFYEVLFQSKYL
jgi:hypothetical protein